MHLIIPFFNPKQLINYIAAVSTVGRETTIPSPMVLSPRKVIHEKTLVTIASPMAPSPRALQQQPSMEEMIEAPMSAPMSPMGARVLGPLIFGSARAQGMRPYMEVLLFGDITSCFSTSRDDLIYILSTFSKSTK